MLLPLLSLLLLHLVHLATSLSCLPCCTGQSAQDHQDIATLYCLSCDLVDSSECASGELTKDVCGCCDVCAKAAGQECGGPWGVMGTCAASYLYCDFSAQEIKPDSFDFNAVGVCKQKNPTTECCERKVVKETLDVYTLMIDSGRDALEECLDNCVFRKEGDVGENAFCFKKGDLQVECQ